MSGVALDSLRLLMCLLNRLVYHPLLFRFITPFLLKFWRQLIDGIEVEEGLSFFNCWRCIDRYPAATIVVFIAVDTTFATPTGSVYDEGRGIEARSASPNILLKIYSGLNRSTHIFPALNEVMDIYVVGLNLDVSNTPHQGLHLLSGVVHAAEENRLVADLDARIKKSTQRPG